jgi:hypothetical protein
LIKMRQVQPNFRRYRPVNAKSVDPVPSVSTLVKYFLSGKTKEVDLPGFHLTEADCAILMKNCKGMRSLNISYCPQVTEPSLVVKRSLSILTDSPPEADDRLQATKIRSKFRPISRCGPYGDRYLHYSQKPHSEVCLIYRRRVQK